MDMAGPWTLQQLLLFLSLASCSGDAQMAEVGASPVVNLSVDLRKRLFVWELSDHVTWQECKIETPEQAPTWQDPMVEGGGSYSCRFPNAVLHGGANFTINSTSSGGVSFLHSTVLHNPGKEGAAPVDFACIIYAIRFMNCTWAPGPNAPADVRYRLYSWTSWDEAEVECDDYLLNAAGTAVGCHFWHLDESSMTDSVFFLLNGTSAQADIPFLDFAPMHGFKLEKYNTPSNVRSHDNGSYHIIQWENPQRRYELSTHIILYEINIQRKGDSNSAQSVFQRGQDSNEYLLPRSAARAGTVVRVRVKHVYGQYWSDWSHPLTLGTPEPVSRDAHPTLIWPALGTVCLSVTVLAFLCQRLSLTQKLFPHIPQVKREIFSSLDSNPQVTVPMSNQEHDYVMLDEIWPKQEDPPGGDDRAVQPRESPELPACTPPTPTQRRQNAETPDSA